MSFHSVRSCPVLASVHDPLHGYHQPTGALQAICHILQIYICKPWVAHFPAPVCHAYCSVMHSHERFVNQWESWMWANGDSQRNAWQTILLTHAHLMSFRMPPLFISVHPFPTQWIHIMDPHFGPSWYCCSGKTWENPCMKNVNRDLFFFFSLSLSLPDSASASFRSQAPHCDSNVLTSSSELSFESMKWKTSHFRMK